MMADLSTLDDTVPPKTEKVSLGDDRIRETRDTLITSFGKTLPGTGAATSEHYLKGAHKIPRGVRPAVGNSGRMYINLTDGWFELDDGLNFNQLHTVGLKTFFTFVSNIDIPPAVFGTMASLAFKTRSNSAVFFYAQFNVVSNHSIPRVNVESRILLDGSNLGLIPGAGNHRTSAIGFPHSASMLFWYNGFIPAGTHSADFQLRVILGDNDIYGDNDCTQVMFGTFVS
jgi:hypothetical protein